MSKAKFHWREVPLKHLATLNPEVLTESTPQDYQLAYVDIGSVTLEAGIETIEEMSFAAAPSRARRRVRDGDTIVSTVRTYLRAIAPVVKPPANLIVSTGFAVIRPRHNVDPRFLSYALRSSRFVEAVVAESVGVSYPAIAPTKLGCLGVWVCPPVEQRAVADFLDREIAKIDALIAKQQELIERIAEARQSVFFQTTTKGINQSVAMKDSGVRWLGNVPEHWSVTPIKRIARLKSGDGITSDEIAETGSYPVFGGNGLRGFSEKYTHDGDFALIGRQGALCGNVNYSQGKFWASEHAIVVTPIREMALLWLGELLRSMNLNQYSVAAAQPGLSVESIGNLICPLPPYQEQIKIAERLSEEDERFSLLTCKAKEAIALLREHRSALIVAAVAGEIDDRVASIQPQPLALNDNCQAVRTAVGAEIVARHGGAKSFGRVKLQKLLYLAEVHTGVHELAGNYLREAAGPLARDLLSDAERGMATAGYYNTVAPLNDGDGYTYSRLGKAGAHRDQFVALLGSRADALTKLIDLLKDYDTRAVEAVATLYAVWNDALLDGETLDEDRIVRGVLEEWHPEKKVKFTPADLKLWLAWMKRNGVVPTGSGSRTQLDRLFV